MSAENNIEDGEEDLRFQSYLLNQQNGSNQEDFRSRIENILYLINRYQNISNFDNLRENNNNNYYRRIRMNEFSRNAYQSKELETSLIPALRDKIITFNNKKYSYYHLCQMNLIFTNKYNIIINIDFTAKKILLITKYIVYLNILDKEIICNNIDCEKNFCNGKIHLGSKKRKLLIKIEEENTEKLMEELEIKIHDYKYCIECDKLWDIKMNDRYKNIKVNYDVNYDIEEKEEDYDVCDNCIIKNSLNHKTLKIKDTCAICLKSIYENDFTKTLCKHLFHKKCIDTWLISKTTCPLCRYKLKNNNILIEEL